MKANKRVYHAGDFKHIYGTLAQGLSGTSFSSGVYYVTHKEDCENQGAGFDLEHKRPVYSFALDGLNLFPTTWQDCRILNLFNKCLYYWPVYQAYGEAYNIDYYIYYDPVYNTLLDCFEDFYADDVPEDKRVSKFLNELKDGYQIEANDMAEIDGEHYDFNQYIQDNKCLSELADKLRPIEPDAHNTFPVLSKLMIEGDFDILKSKVNESRKTKDLRIDKEDLHESAIEVKYTYDDLKNELENFIDKYELATNIDNMLQKVADLVGLDKKDLAKIANEIASQYSDLYDKTTGRFDNWSAPKDDLFATQLLDRLGYQGTYPADRQCDSTEWGGAVFHLEDVKDIKPENDIAVSLN